MLEKDKKKRPCSIQPSIEDIRDSENATTVHNKGKGMKKGKEPVGNGMTNFEGDSD